MEEDDPFGLKEFRMHMLQMFPQMTPEQLKDDEEHIIRSMIGIDVGLPHVLGSPVLDILSVTIRLNIPPPPHCNWRIFGDICIYYPPNSKRGVIDPFKQYIFQRNSNNSQYLDPSAPFLTLDLASPTFDFFPDLYLYLDLWAKRPRYPQLKPLIEDAFHLDYTNYTDDMFDTVQHCYFVTDNADLCIKYVTYRAACTVEVCFSLNVPTGEQPRQIQVSGRIYASWHHTKGDFKSHLKHKPDCYCVCLFDSCSTLVTTGHLFPLSRPIVAVPSFAIFILEFILSVNGVDYHHILEFPVREMNFSDMDLDVSGFIGHIRLEWENEYLYHDQDEEETTTETERLKRAKLTITEVQESSCFHDTVLDMEVVGKQMTEIFSVYVEAKDKSTVCRVNGTIDVEDNLGENRIFEMNDGNFTRPFTHGTTLALVGPKTCLWGECFLQVHLRNDEGQDFCRGYLEWNGPILRRPWVDKWLCSIIKGELGFTEIHYALFTSAVPCAVSVFLAAPSSCENVYIRGSIVCWYNIEYTTTYEEKYCRSFLLDDEEEGMLLEFRANRKLVNIPNKRSMRGKHHKRWISVPLSKSAVCVPTGKNLLTEVELSVECDSIVSVEKLVGSMEFQIGRKKWYMIKSDDYQMFVSVDWS